MLHLSTECYAKGAHKQCVDDLAIRKTTSVEDDRLEADVGSANNGMDATDRHEVGYFKDSRLG
jgi:hypothetical protein